MVNVFIVHSGNDSNYVKEELEPALCEKEGSPNEKSSANVLSLKSGVPNCFWKVEARNKIKQAQVVLVVIGSDANEESKNKTMGWEVKQAIKRNKQIYILNLGNYKIPKYLSSVDRFTKQENPVGKQLSIEEIKRHIENYSKGYYNVFSSEYEKMTQEEKLTYKEELLEQYKMFQKSSEDLVARRQSVNSFYISVNSAIVALIGVLMGVIGLPTKLYVLIFMCATGMILDFSWIGILESYGRLNAAKMKVITLIEQQLPVILYDVEWQVMSDKLNNKKYVSFTQSEKRIPRIFILIYAVAIIGLGAYFLFQFLLK